jgi:hypothetical protein
VITAWHLSSTKLSIERQSEPQLIPLGAGWQASSVCKGGARLTRFTAVLGSESMTLAFLERHCGVPLTKSSGLALDETGHLFLLRFNRLD